MSLAKQISKIEKELSSLRLMVEPKKKNEKSAPKKSKKCDKKPKNIEQCKSIDEVKMFTVKEIKQWTKEHGIEVKKITEKHKDDWVKLVWKAVKTRAFKDSSSSESDTSSSDSDTSSSDDDSDSSFLSDID